MKAQIFATDISEKVIVKARTGIYSETEMTNISSERREKFFTKTDGGFLINKSIRDMCVFANHNILIDPPFANIDLISCRNVLIYMDTFLQRKVMAAFHYALHEKGVLLLGKSESLGKSMDLFTTLDEVDKIYTRKSVPGRFIQVVTKRKEEVLASQVPKLLKEIRPNDDFQKHADEIILAKAPAGVVVNDQLEIVQFRGATGDWLESASGKPSLSVLKMAKHGLVLELRSAIHKAKSTMLPVVKEQISLHNSKGGKKLVTLEVIPISTTINTYFLILFKNVAELADEKIDINDSGKLKLSPLEVRTQFLEKELSEMRNDMRIVTEDQEAANGELLGANEELLSNSEELRSLNEELEISKEELQSTVEELSVSNQELGFRNEQLTHSRKYAEAIVTTIREPLIILDRDLRVKSANNSFYKTFKKTEHETEGKMFYELENNQWDIPALRNLLERILHEKTFYDSYELKQKFSANGERIMILNARKILSEGTNEQLILLAIEDVTERRNIDDQLKKNADYIKAILETSPQMVSTATADGSVTYFNKFFLDYTGLSFQQAIGWGWQLVVPPEMLEDVTAAWKYSISTGAEFEKELQFKRHDGMYRWHISRALPLRNEDGIITSWVSTTMDIHDQKMFTEELEQQVRKRTESLKNLNNDLAHANKNLEQLTFIASHDLQEPLRKIKLFSNLIVDSYSKNLPLEGVTFLNKIQKSTERMSDLIKDVLSFSQTSSSKNIFLKTDLNDIFNNVVSEFQLLIEEKYAVIKQDKLPVLEVIPIQINQLFYNLMSNSLKFSHADRAPIITVTSHVLTKAQVTNYATLNKDVSYCEIVVSDNGIGIDPDYCDKIFLIFQRLHTKDKYHGTGIGLALCKKIALNHHGEIVSECNRAGGMLFRIILPVTQTHDTEEIATPLMLVN
jgi:two-component system CheB/CheR fusion protein